jgi:hypothetical protein
VLVRVLASGAFLFLAFVGDLVSARDGLVYLFGTTRMDFQRPDLTAGVLDRLV